MVSDVTLNDEVCDWKTCFTCVIMVSDVTLNDEVCDKKTRLTCCGYGK